MVRSARHRLYVRLRRAGCRRTDVGLPTVVQEVTHQRPRDGYLRQPRAGRLGVYDRRYPLRGALGEGSLGALLGVGPQGDLGCCDMVRLSGLYPRAHPFGPLPPCSTLGALHLLRPPADVLVGHQLPTLCPRHQRPHLQLGLRLSAHKPL